jgi:mRNA-degrading endonuclease RelE of RelBE toxin-antitoxin system
MPVVVLTPASAKQVDQLPRPIRARMMRIIQRLASWPDVSGAKPLQGKLAGRFRVRTGDYRLQFYPAADKVIVERIGHRDGFYED